MRRQILRPAMTALLLGCLAGPAAAQHFEMQMAPPGNIPFHSVADAWRRLSLRDGAQPRTTRDGWTEFEDERRNRLWSFVPEEHPAYPTVIMRTVRGRGMAMEIVMDGLCEAERSACEALMKELARKNEIARNRFVRTPPRGAAAKADVPPIAGLLSAR